MSDEPKYPSVMVGDVELIARPEVDRLIAAERERCAAIAAEVCRTAMLTDPHLTDYEHGWWGASTEIERKIREVSE